MNDPVARHVFRLPDIGEGIADAEIVNWHIKVGDRIAEDQPTVDLMTDKATVEMTTPVAGTVVALHGAVGDRVAVGAPLIELDRDEPTPPAAEPIPVAVATPVVAASPATGAQPLAAPATRLSAHNRGIDLGTVAGSGPDGRITPDDLDRHAAPATPAASAAAGGVQEIRIVGLRRRIAERLQDAVRRIPHFTYVEEIDCTELEALRQSLNVDLPAGGTRLTLLPFFMQALVLAVRAHPRINARFDDEAGILSVHEAVHVGIATQCPDGLMVPVVRHVETRDLWNGAQALRQVTEAARGGTATREMLTGSTITLSSLGALGGLSATPIINAPEVAIIGPNRLVERPVVVGGQVVVRRMMNVSSSFDHRIIDGHDAARFIASLKRVLEQPALLFLPPRGG